MPHGSRRASIAPASNAAHGRRIAGIALGVIALVLHAVLLWRGLFARPVLSFSDRGNRIADRLADRPDRGRRLVAAAALRRHRGRADGRRRHRRRDDRRRRAPATRWSAELGNWRAHRAVDAGVRAAHDRRRAGCGVAAAGSPSAQPPAARLAARSLPSVEALEAGTFQALTAGFAVLTLALFSGFVFVDNLFAQHLVHKTVLSCLAWVVFAVLLFGRWRFGWRGRTATNWALSGFALLGLAYFGSKIVLESILGRHWG